MSSRFAGLVGFCAWLVASVAGAQGTPVIGPNSDFPDANLVMPFDASTNHDTFFSISNVDSIQVTNTWVFYDESGQTLASVDRDIPGNGGTDVVDPLSVRTRSIDANGQITEGNPQSLAGSRGFVVVQGPGDGVDRLMGNFTLANTATGSAFGANAIGLGAIGTVQQGDFIVGTTFNPTTLQDSELIIVGLNVPNITSLTNGAAPPAEPLMVVSLSLDSNNGQLATNDVNVNGTALFSSLPNLFPGASLNISATISAIASEGPGYSGTSFDPDADQDLGIIGWYGEAVGQFGAAQSLRTISSP